jgi:L-2-hydroxyglutarate oxidase
MGKVDIAIVGSGAIGLGVARGLKELDPTLSIAIFEKEPGFSTHASARNSGVLHAGFYYSPESLKAKFCRDGREELETLISKYSLPLMKVGKVVIATNEDEDNRITALLDRGLANGVQLERLPSSELNRFEPLAVTHGSFLWSPNTSIANPTLVNTVIRQELEDKGIQFFSNSHVEFRNRQWKSNNLNINADYFINAAGAWALDIAHQMQIGASFRTMPFLGLYKQTSTSKLPIRTLVYPVPHPINPFLGVHFTLTLDGKVKIGPSALPIIGKSQYAFKSPITAGEVVNYARNLVSLSKGNKHDLIGMMKYEIPKLLTSNLVSTASRLVPVAKHVKDWKPKPPGIRGQLIDVKNGELLQDFVIEHRGKSTHILNAVSPGWTAAIPFGRHVAQSALERLNSSL